jgi:histidine triad (HIT) family protein
MVARAEGRVNPAGCQFCRIVRREISASVVHEDESAIVFLDHRPLFPGHCLLAPRAHHATLQDLPPELVGPFFSKSQRVCRAVEAGLGAQGSFVAINNKVSQSVPHLHVHVVPRRFKDGMRGFFWPRQGYESAAHMEDVRARIAAALGGAGAASPERP